MSFVLAGDIGGTKTLLGLFDRGRPRPAPLAVRTFATLEYTDLTSMLDAFFKAERTEIADISAACFGLAGPVMGDVASLTNVPWTIDARQMANRLGFASDRSGVGRVRLLNDLQAMAHALPVLEASELRTLQKGHAIAGGSVALIAAGTGLGEAIVHSVDRRWVPTPSEGGHADFAARNEREIVLLRSLIESRGRAEIEHVVSGPGLVNIHRVTHQSACQAGVDLADPNAPAAISTAALDRRCAACTEALELFVEAYGAEAGNLALRALSSGGVFIGGGIAPKILPALTDGRFMKAFRDKAPFESLLASMPVMVILSAEAGLLGAAVAASHLAESSATR